MASYTTDQIRNIALVGSAGAGKTTLLEAMLHRAGVIGRPGRVEDKNTICDFDDLEKELGQSLESAIVHFDHANAHINAIDTPGSADFIGMAFSVLPAVEVAVIVVDAGGRSIFPRRSMH